MAQLPLFLILRFIVLQPSLVNCVSQLSPICRARTHPYLLLVTVFCLYTQWCLWTLENARFLENSKRLRCQIPGDSTQGSRCALPRAQARCPKVFCAGARATELALCAFEILSSLWCIRVSGRFRCACILGRSARQTSHGIQAPTR